MSFIKARYKRVQRRVRVGLHDKVEPTTLANIPYRFGELLVVPVERKRHRGAVRIKRGVGAYVVRHEFHRRRWFTVREPRRGAFRTGSGKRTAVRSTKLKIENSRRSVDSMQDSEGEAEKAERKLARTSETIPVPAPSIRPHIMM